MASRSLPERWPVAGAMGLAALVLLVVTWLVNPALAVGVVVGVLFAAACVAFVVVWARRGSALTESDVARLHRAELALVGAAGTEAAARELSKLAMIVLEAPAAVVIVDGVGEGIHMEAGDTAGHPIANPGSLMQVLSDNGVALGSIAVSARPGRPYGEHDLRVLTALAGQMSFVLHRLALFEGVRMERAALVEVIASLSDGMFSVDSDQVIRSWNASMERLTNIPAGAAIGQPCCATFRPFDEEGDPLYDATCPGRKGAPVEVLAQLPAGDGDEPSDGPTVWIECEFSPTPDDGYVVVARDVSARKQMEDDRADFLTTVSFELRTPLAPLKRFLETLRQRDGELDASERQHAYDVMYREEQRLERVVQQLVQSSALEEPAVQVVTAQLDWAKAVREQVDCIQREEPDRVFSITMAENLPPVIGDDQMAAQVLANLLSNAERFSPDDTPVEVEVEYARERMFTTITDQGPGIPDDDRERIFEKFTRLDGNGRAEPGAGLGLYIVRRSVEAMGGTIWVDDGPAGGSAFSFTLPAVPVKAKRSGVRTR